MEIETGYKLDYTISKMRSIKITEAGDFEGKKYSASVKIKSINVMQEENEDYGLVEKETIIEFKFPCENKQLKSFNIFLRGLQKANKPLTFKGAIPRDAGKDTYTVTCLSSIAEITKAKG